MRDLYHQSYATNMLKPQTLTAATGFSSSVDLQGFNGANVLVTLGTIGEATMTSTSLSIRMYESDDNVTFTPVAEADLLGATSGTTTGQFVLVDSFAEDDKSYLGGYGGDKRYIKTYQVWTGSIGTGVPIAIACIKGEPIHAPSL